MLRPVYLGEVNFGTQRTECWVDPSFCVAAKSQREICPNRETNPIRLSFSPRPYRCAEKKCLQGRVLFFILIGVYHFFRITTHRYYHAIYLHGDRRVSLKCHLFIVMSALPRLYHNTVRQHTRITYCLQTFMAGGATRSVSGRLRF